MLKKFIDGLIFGSGFAISFVAIVFMTGYTLYPMLISTVTESASQQLSQESLDLASEHAFPDNQRQSSIPFHELPVEEQIKKASAIALARYEKSPDGKMKAVIKEFLKKDPGVVVYYNTGDEYTSSSYYPNINRSYGDGVIIFFTGSPARMSMSVTYTGDRINGLADIPVELFKQKCQEPNT
ncbi:MAG TPA: hypothetical protein VGD24_07430 [Gallionella sp.]